MGIAVLAAPAGLTDAAGRALSTVDPSDATAATAAANTAVVTTYAAAPFARHRLTWLALSYSAAPAGGRITVTDGGSTILDLDTLTLQESVIPLPPGGLQGSVNTAMTVTLAAGGVGVVGKLNTAKYTV